MSAAVFFVALLFAGCAKKPQPPSEAEVRANAVLNATFASANAEYWYAVQKIGATTRLVEFHRPNPALLPQSVSETDQMNGIAERYHLTLSAAQYRYWNGSWTPWQQGIQGGGVLVSQLMGGAGGFWMVVIEKKNRAWQAHSQLGSLVQDRATLQRLMVAANAGGA